MALHIRPFRFIAPLAILALAACAPAEDEGGEAETSDTVSDATPDNAAQGEPMLMADTGWLSVGDDGAVQTTFLDTAGRYRDFRNGVAADTGDWEQRPDGSLCFSPDAGDGGCWTPESPDKDGSLIVTNAGGKRVEIKRITYTAPSPNDSSDEDAQKSN